LVGGHGQVCWVLGIVVSALCVDRDINQGDSASRGQSHGGLKTTLYFTTGCEPFAAVEVIV